MNCDFDPFLDLFTANFTVFDGITNDNEIKVASHTCGVCELVFDTPLALNDHFMISRNCVDTLLPRLGDKDKAKAITSALFSNGQSQRSSRELKRSNEKRSEAVLLMLNEQP